MKVLRANFVLINAYMNSTSKFTLHIRKSQGGFFK